MGYEVYKRGEGMRRSATLRLGCTVFFQASRGVLRKRRLVEGGGGCLRFLGGGDGFGESARGGIRLVEGRKNLRLAMIGQCGRAFVLSNGGRLLPRLRKHTAAPRVGIGVGRLEFGDFSEIARRFFPMTLRRLDTGEVVPRDVVGRLEGGDVFELNGGVGKLALLGEH